MTATDRTFAQVAISEFIETGEVSGLLALADWYTENNTQHQLRALIRESDPEEWERVLWFCTHAGTRYDPEYETQEEGTLRTGLLLAMAELWYAGNKADQWELEPGELELEWQQDYDPRPDQPAFGWACVLRRWDGREWEVVGSLGGIHFAGGAEPWGQDYARVVEAELALELMPDA